MRKLLRLATMTLVLFLAATPVHAGMLALDLQGETYGFCSIDNAQLPFATTYTVQADFDPTMGTILEPGVATYMATSLAVTVAGTSYTVTEPSDFSLTLVDPTNTIIPGFYYVLFDNNSGVAYDELGPAYTMATPTFSATDPTPTVFSGYTGSQAGGNIQTFSTAAGPLVLSFDLDLGLRASINSVPEPSSLALCGVGGLIGLVVARRRRKRTA